MISIITPTHKIRPLLDLTIKSVLSQTFSDFEWVVLDNSEEGYFEQYLNKWLEENPKYLYRKDKVKIIRYRLDVPNVGKYKNKCVEYTSCGLNDYILLLDHDDFLVDTALEKIHKLTLEYPTAQFLSGDKMLLNYNINNQTFYLYNNEYITDELIAKENLHWVSGNINIKVDDWGLDMGYLENYCLRYYDILDIYEDYHINEFQHQLPIHNKIVSHPRCFKKYILQNPIYQFYENHNFSEDLVQCNMVGYFCQGVYLKDISVVNVLYDDQGNTSTYAISEEDICSYLTMIENMDRFQEEYYKLFHHIPYHQTFLNIKNKYN